MTRAIATFTIQRVSGAEAHTLIEPLADVLLDCVEGGGSVGFMWPLHRQDARDFWRGIAIAVEQGERALFIATDAHGDVAGTVQLVLQQPDNQPHRADLAKMLVHRSARRQGLAARLLAAAEDTARDEGRSVLVLDTVTGGDAERGYARAGWQRVGEVPNYALLPHGGFCSTTFFWKGL